jgi:hypothetical protein
MEQEQYTREPLSYFKKELMEEAKYKYKPVEVEYMAGIIPTKERLPGNEYKHKKAHVKAYNENAIELYNDKHLHSGYIYLDKDDVDYNFFKEQYEFLLSLTEVELSVLKAYSDKYGSVVLNLVKNHREDKEFLEKELAAYDLVRSMGDILGVPREEIWSPKHYGNWELRRRQDESDQKRAYIIGLKYYEAMTNILKKAPTIKKQIRVFRGIKPSETNYKIVIPKTKLNTSKKENLEKYISGNYLSHNLTYLPRNYLPNLFSGFVSTTYEPEVATSFTEQTRGAFYLQKAEVYRPRENCCILDILVKPGIKAVWLSPISQFHTTVKERFSDPNDRGNTEREILLYCDQYVKTTISKPRMRQPLQYGRADVRDLFRTYDVIVEPQRLARGVGSRTLVAPSNTTEGGTRKRRSAQKGKSRRQARK